MRDCWSIQYFDRVALHLTSINIDHVQLFESQRVLWIVDVPDHFEDLERVYGIIMLFVFLLLATILLLVRAQHQLLVD